MEPTPAADALAAKQRIQARLASQAGAGRVTVKLEPGKEGGAGTGSGPAAAASNAAGSGAASKVSSEFSVNTVANSLAGACQAPAQARPQNTTLGGVAKVSSKAAAPPDCVAEQRFVQAKYAPKIPAKRVKKEG